MSESRLAKRGLLGGVVCLCSLAGIAVHFSSKRVALAGAPFGSRFGGYYDAGYYGAYQNPFAYEVARQDYWDAMAAYDPMGARSYDDWVAQRCDWDRAGYGYGPYDSEAHAAYYRSADQNGWGDQTRFNDYLTNYYAERGGEYPYGYPSIAGSFEQRGGLFRRAGDPERLPARRLAEGKVKHAPSPDSKRLRSSASTTLLWQPLQHRQLAIARSLSRHDAGALPAPRAAAGARARDGDDKAAPTALTAYERAAATFRRAVPGATYGQWLAATRQWDAVFLDDRELDREQAALDRRKAAALQDVLAQPAFPALRQLDTAEEARVHVPQWVPALHMQPGCNAAMHERRWKESYECKLCRDEGSDCDKCAANAKAMLCEFLGMKSSPSTSLLHFTPLASLAELDQELTQMRPNTEEVLRDLRSKRAEEDTAEDYAAVDEALVPLNAWQSRLNHARLALYMRTFGLPALEQVSSAAAASAGSSAAPSLAAQLAAPYEGEGPGFLRWRASVHGRGQEGPRVRRGGRASLEAAPVRQMLAESKLRKLGVNLGGNPLDPTPARDALDMGASLAGRQTSVLHSGVSAGASAGGKTLTPVAFWADCAPGSPSTLCDHGVYVGEEAQTKAQDVGVHSEGLEEPYRVGVSPHRELSGAIGGDFFGHVSEAPMTRLQVQELSR